MEALIIHLSMEFLSEEISALLPNSSSTTALSLDELLLGVVLTFTWLLKKSDIYIHLIDSTDFLF